MSERALVVTHPHENYDHQVVGEDFIEYTETFEGDTYVVPSIKSDRCERPYGDMPTYDKMLEEENYGHLKEEDVDFLEENYDEIVLAGGYSKECLRNTHSSFSGSDIDIKIEPSISYSQSFNNTEGFTLSEVIATGDEEVVDKYLGHFNDGRTGLV